MGQARWRKLPRKLRSEVIRRAARGETYREIIDGTGVTVGSVTRVLKPLGGVYRDAIWQTPSGRYLSAEERAEIRVSLERGDSIREIARTLGRAPSSISREINNNGGRGRYQCMKAHEQAYANARRPKVTKLAANPRLCARVTQDLERLWSPEQIARRLRAEFPDNPEMRVSHETIYQSLYVQGRGELRRELARCLRTGRAKRRRRRHGETRGARIPDMVNISERPADVEDRAVAGHWEGDLILGKDGRSAIGTLVERQTRFVLLLHLPKDHTAAAVRDAMTEAIQTLPAALCRSITWDQGTEMAEHAHLTIDTGIDVYFCDPHSPWQRGSNENTNGLLRQYFPKGTDLSVFTKADLDAAADSLNGRPRKTLNWMTPAEKLTELLVASAA